MSVQSAKVGSTLISLGRADVGSVFKDALVFNGDELAKDLGSIPKLDEEVFVKIPAGIRNCARRGAKAAAKPVL